MQLVMDILQAAGIGAACGINPFLPVLVAGGLAHAKLGVDYKHTPYAFLEDSWFLLAATAAFVVTALTRGYWVGARADALATVGIILGGLEGAGTAGRPRPPGGDRLGRRRARRGARMACDAATCSAASAPGSTPRPPPRLPLYAYAASLLIAVATILAPPLTIVVIGFLVWLLIGGRRRSQEKYAGLRCLR